MAFEHRFVTLQKLMQALTISGAIQVHVHRCLKNKQSEGYTYVSGQMSN